MSKFLFINRFRIGNKLISENSGSFIIAEAGVAHFGNLKKAFKLIDLAKKAGADAVKFQAYITDELIDKDFTDWYKRYKIKEVGFSFLQKLKNYCYKKKIIFLFTPHSETAIDWAKKLKLPAIKIGSGELGNYRFLEKVILLKKPIIISTGMHTKKNLLDLKKFFVKKKYRKVIFLRCVTSYPTENNHLNLNNLATFRKIFNSAIIGYSDHTDSDLPIYFAVSNFAKVIEKHIALDFNLKNAQDWKVSHNETRLKNLIKNIRLLETIGGANFINPSQKELKNKIWATKSLFYKTNLKKGQIIKESMICAKRPGSGICCSEYPNFIGRKLKKNCKIGMIKRDDFF